MAQPTTTFLDELLAAARGCVALLAGNRQAPAFFDFSQRGLVGSFIALVLSFGIQILVPQTLGSPAPAGVSIGVLLLGGLVVGVQFGVAWLVLRQLGRLDGFTPFLVAQNWASLFQTVIAVSVIALLGEPFTLAPDGEMVQFTTASLPFVAIGIGAIVLSVNIARLILTLRPLHVALFVGAQLATMLFIQPMMSALV